MKINTIENSPRIPSRGGFWGDRDGSLRGNLQENLLRRFSSLLWLRLRHGVREGVRDAIVDTMLEEYWK